MAYWVCTSPIRHIDSYLSERAFVHRCSTPCVFEEGSWYEAREMAAIYYGVNREKVSLTVVETVQPNMVIRREGIDLVCSVPGFFEEEVEDELIEFTFVESAVESARDGARDGG